MTTCGEQVSNPVSPYNPTRQFYSAVLDDS